MQCWTCELGDTEHSVSGKMETASARCLIITFPTNMYDLRLLTATGYKAVFSEEGSC